MKKLSLVESCGVLVGQNQGSPLREATRLPSCDDFIPSCRQNRSRILKIFSTPTWSLCRVRGIIWSSLSLHGKDAAVSDGGHPRITAQFGTRPRRRPRSGLSEPLLGICLQCSFDSVFPSVGVKGRSTCKSWIPLTRNGLQSRSDVFDSRPRLTNSSAPPVAGGSRTDRCYEMAGTAISQDCCGRTRGAASDWRRTSSNPMRTCSGARSTPRCIL
jgi:hypothetical protein